MHTRKEIENLEDKFLAPYAMKSKDSKGRIHDNTPHPTRTCYQRDRDRIVHCEAFRKLEYKTQVFVILEGDYYRTRLTHTIEVAQIARTIGRSLGLNQDLIEAIALAHDLGHPPFGHAGETALSQIMQEVDEQGFNHNFRSYEIVTRFEKRYPGFTGLDLTEEVIVGILKHETNYDISEKVKEYEKIGASLEAKVVDIADALAYLSHDVDDGLTSGLISEDDLKDSKMWQYAYKKVAPLVKSDSKEVFKYQIVKALIEMQTRDLLEQSAKNLKKRKFNHSDDVKSYFAKPQSNSESGKIIDYTQSMKSQRNELQKLLFDKLYRHYRVERMTEKARRIINEIFDVYQENPNQLPYEYWSGQRKPERTGNKSAYQKKLNAWNKKYKKKQYQEICNYIAGMTDRYALDEHKKLFEPYQKV